MEIYLVMVSDVDHHKWGHKHVSGKFSGVYRASEFTLENLIKHLATTNVSLANNVIRRWLVLEIYRIKTESLTASDDERVPVFSTSPTIKRGDSDHERFVYYANNNKDFE